MKIGVFLFCKFSRKKSRLGIVSDKLVHTGKEKYLEVKQDVVKKMIPYLFASLGGVIGYHFNDWIQQFILFILRPVFGLNDLSGSLYWITGVSAFVLFFASTWISKNTMKWIHRGEENLSKIPFQDLMAGIIGLIIGLVIDALLIPVFKMIAGFGAVLSFIAPTFLGYYGFRLGYRMKDELFSAIFAGRQGPDKSRQVNIEEHKILDTSVIIDGRIADICKTGFIEGTLVIPEFVLEELQHIADSSDLLKRNRGRRGLDILNKIQKELDVQVLIYEGDFEEISEVDSKLVKLAKVLQGKVVTNDFNLNKVCELQGVSVLNINDLANAVKPVVLPGEEIVVQVIKDGKEHGQGVAYLDDGTMIVVEGGRDYIGAHIEVLVTSVLQTSAGRMIFAKPKLLEKAQ